MDDQTSLEFVLVAVIIHESNLVKFQKECKSLKGMIWYLLGDKTRPTAPDDFELHMKEICNRTHFFKSLENDDEKWFSVMKNIFKRISKLNIHIISSIIIKDKFKEEGFEDVKKWAFTLLVERLQRFIRYKGNLDQFLLTVLDSEGPDSDDQKREMMKEFVISGTGHGWEEYAENVFETPFIVDSQVHLGVQIADAVAYVLRRYVYKILNRNPTAFFNEHCDTFLSEIGHLFHRSEGDRVNGYGIKIFPHTYTIDPKFWDIFKRKDIKTLDDF